MSQPPPRGPPGPPPGSPPPDGGPPDARVLARPAGPPPARPILGPRALPPGVIPRPPGPPQAPPPTSVISPTTVPLDVRKPPPRGPPPVSPTSTPGGPPMPGPPSGPPSGMPPPRMPGPPPGGPPSGPSAPVSPVGPPPSPGPPSGPPPRGPVVAAFEGGKARAPPKAPPPPDAAPAKAGGKAAPSLPPPGPGAPPPAPKPLERAEEKAAVPGSAPATPSEALPKPSTPTTPTRVPTAPQAATATPAGPSPSTPPPDAMPAKPAVSPTPQGKPPAPTALPADTMPPKPTAPSVPQPKPPAPSAVPQDAMPPKPTAPSVPQPKPPAPSAVPQDAMPPKPKPPTPTGQSAPSSPAPPKTGAPPRGPPPTAQGAPADAPRPPSESTTPTSPGSVITQATSSTGSTTSSAPPVRSTARPKPPTRPGDQPAPPDKDGAGVQKLVRSINPETGLPYGLQPAPPSGPPPPAEEKKNRDRDRPERLTGVSVDDKEGGEEDGKKGGEEVTPKGRKPPSEAPPPLPEEDKEEPDAGAPSATTTTAAPDLVIDEEPVEMEAEGTGPPPQAAAPPPPPPPTDVLGPADLFAEDANAQALRKRLKRGRLHIQLVTAKNVRRKDQVAAPTNLNAYVVALLGKTKEPVKAKSEVIKKAGAFIDFNRDELVLNVAEPEALVFKDQIHLLLELWDQGAWQEELLGRGEVPALPFMDMPGAKFEFPLTLLYPGDASSNMELHSQASFEPAKVGMLVFTLYEGRGLKTRGKMDNFITVNMGDKYQKRSASVKDGRGSPYFREERLIMWASATNWVDDVWLRVWDEDGGANQLIGEVRFSALPYMSVMPDKFAPQVFALTRLDEDRVGPPVLEESGEVVVKAEFLVAGTMSITVVEAKRLRKSNKAVGRQDPYVVLKMDGQAVALTRKTKVDKDGGSEPVWNETLVFDIVDQYLLEVEVWDQDMRGRDEQIGKCSFSLLSVFKKGAVDTWVVVKRAGDDGLPDESGDVHLVFDFYGPSGIAYPQCQPTVDSYDERARTNLPDDQKAKFARKTEAIVPQQDAKAKTAKGDQGRSYEFTDDEIDEAFHFIDLDKNTFLGAAEIRHILVCMGELVTDEEIDAMIHLVDADGDGQVSFREFYKMCIHPNPAQYDCRATKEAEMIGQEQAKKSDYDREREMAEREEKRKLFTVLTQDNAIGVVESRKIFERFRNMSVKLSTKGIDFDVFCTLLGVLPTGQYHKLFNLYDREGGGYIDMKEFILGLFNFVNMEKEEKVSLIFQLFDEDRSGFLSEEEIREILKATHLQTADAVNAKLATLMKQVKSADRTLTYEEFMIIAKKFPTILFPPNIGGGKEDDDINPITGKRK